MDYGKRNYQGVSVMSLESRLPCLERLVPSRTLLPVEEHHNQTHQGQFPHDIPDIPDNGFDKDQNDR